MALIEPSIGLVIPTILDKFIEKTVQYLIKTNDRPDLIIYIVNNGIKHMKDFLDLRSWPKNVNILHLPKNRRFAGANNAGWRKIIEDYPSVKYLGTINDDTKPYDCWLDPLVNALNREPRIAAAQPILEEKYKFGMKRKVALWEYIDEGYMIRPLKTKIVADSLTPILQGFCFIARRDALEQVEFFDEAYQNSAEDVDLGLKLIQKGWRLMVCNDSLVYHFGAASRYLPGAHTDIQFSLSHFKEKWGTHLSQFNEIAAKFP